MKPNFNKFLSNKKHSNDEHHMKIALEQAAIAKSMGEQARGTVIVFSNDVISSFPTAKSKHNPIAFAEMNALAHARHLNKKSFKDAVMYSTVEPNIVSFLSAYEHGIREYVWGCDDVESGFVSSLKLDVSNYDIAISPGLLSEQCYNICTMHMREHLRHTNKEINNETHPSRDS